MLAIALSDKMQPFYDTLASYPTLLLSILLVVVLMYWCVAVLGLIDISFLDVDIDMHVDAEGVQPTANVLAGLLLRFNLNKVPVTVVLSFVALYGWGISFFCMYVVRNFSLHWLISFLLGTVVLMLSLFCALWLTAWSIRPLRPFFSGLAKETHRSLVGQCATVRTSRVDASFGEALLDKEGVSLTLQVRHFEDQKIEYDDTVTLVAFDREGHFYHVMLAEED